MCETSIVRAPSSGRPRPGMSADTAFFWEGAAEGRLLIQRCTACATLRHPPGPMCPQCYSTDWDAHESAGTGTINSYTVLHYPKPAGFTDVAVVVLVDLDDGTRLLSNLEADPSEINIGDRVEVIFIDQEEGWSMPAFRLADGAEVGGL